MEAWLGLGLSAAAGGAASNQYNTILMSTPAFWEWLHGWFHYRVTAPCVVGGALGFYSTGLLGFDYYAGFLGFLCAFIGVALTGVSVYLLAGGSLLDVEERYWELAGSCGLFLAAVGGSALVASLSFWFIFGCLIVSTAGFIAFWMCPGPESS